MALFPLNREAALAALTLLAANAPVAAGSPAGPGPPMGASGSAAGAPAPAPQSIPQDTPSLGIMGTIPIIWGEAADLGEILDGTARPHWARAALERDWQLIPLDYLDAASLARVDRLLLAQPRGLSAEENVALDSWVRAGGSLLLFADPMMTGATRFALGDRRRPQDVALISPILAHWGLALEFAADQPAGLAWRDIAGGRVPVEMAGRFAPLAGGEAECVLITAEAPTANVRDFADEADDPVLARCAVGKGQALLMADAALLDFAGPHEGSPEALALLLDLAFAKSREMTGTAPVEPAFPLADDANPPDSPAINPSASSHFP